MAEDKKAPLYYGLSPLRLLIIMGASIFVIEAGVMAALHYLHPSSPVGEALLDSAVLVALLSPILYFLFFRPILLQFRQRRVVEEDLRKERDRARRYLAAAGVIMVVVDTEGRTALINRKGAEILGRREEDILGKNWFDNFVPEHARDEVRAAFAGMKRDYPYSAGREHAGYFESPVLTDGGTERVILWHNTPLIEDGAITGTLSSGEDITERKKMEKALIESETRYRLLHDTAFDGIIISDDKDRIIDTNASAEKIFGYERGELYLSGITRLMPEAYRKRHLDGLKSFLDTGRSAVQGRVLLLEGLKKDGTIFPIELVLSSFNVRGAVNFTGTIRDITERRRAEKERERIQGELNQAQKMDAVGRLAGGIAHDFNNILTSVSGNAELALEEMDGADPLYPRLKEIMASVAHAVKLVRQLLLFSRGHPFELKTLNINSTVENITSMLKRLLGDSIVIVTDLSPEVWTIQGDESTIEQILINLAVNARDAMPDGGRISIKTENIIVSRETAGAVPGARPGRGVCLSFTDTGVGMDRETLPRIFEPFF
ncbi:MAG: PAS domain S-box protein, partial [Deltaproteobacteria bacterium]|nr:PAS domain S-box protein [Deltaproteobacteria bacterium]